MFTFLTIKKLNPFERKFKAFTQILRSVGVMDVSIVWRRSWTGRHYAGKLTRRATRLEGLYDKQGLADLYRWQPNSFPHCLRKALFAYWTFSTE